MRPALCCSGCKDSIVCGEGNCMRNIEPIDYQFPTCPYCQKTEDGSRPTLKKQTVVIHTNANDKGKYQCDELLLNTNGLVYFCDDYITIGNGGNITTRTTLRDGAIVMCRSYTKPDWDMFVVRDGKIMPMDYYVRGYCGKS